MDKPLSDVYYEQLDPPPPTSTNFTYKPSRYKVCGWYKLFFPDSTNPLITSYSIRFSRRNWKNSFSCRYAQLSVIFSCFARLPLSLQRTLC